LQSLQNADISGKVALIRVDFNVPLNQNFEITDDSRIRASLPTINFIIEGGGAVALLSHLGRPKNGFEQRYSLRHIVAPLSTLLGRDVRFISDCLSEEAYQICRNLRPGEVALLENVRFYKEETAGDPIFAQRLARLGDFYVNDAFGAAHRAHASTAVIAQYFAEKYAGFLLEKEITFANRALEAYTRPFVVFIGGAKVTDKIKVIENLLTRATHLFIGGAMAYTFFKALGYSVGASQVEQDALPLALTILAKAKKLGVTLVLPQDSIISQKIEAGSSTRIADNVALPEGWIGLDIGPKAIAQAEAILQDAQTILWNGPMGVFEIPDFAQGTLALARLIANQTEKGAFSLVGGGDSAAALAQSGVGNKISYVSTGGGAMLEYLEGKTLPGIAALS
jgi:phosphoglycerate kinase